MVLKGGVTIFSTLNRFFRDIEHGDMLITSCKKKIDQPPFATQDT